MNIYKTTTDDTLRETVQHGNGCYPFAYYLEDIWEFDFHCIDWHWHHELEFVYAAEGTIICLVGTEKIQLNKGCGLFINSGVLHRFESEDHTVFPNIVFSPTLLVSENSLIYEKYMYPIITSSLPYQILNPQISWQKLILDMLLRIFSLQEHNKDNELLTVQCLFKIWCSLFENLDLFSDSSTTRCLTHQQARLQAMMQYIHDHYSQEITLKEISRSASISKSGALHIFKSYLQISPVAYLIQYRLTRAAQLLCTTEKNVCTIANESGFSSAGYFCRKFKQAYSMTPNKYRSEKALIL